MALERQTILAALAKSDGNVGQAARALGCSRRTLQHRMMEYGIPQGKAGRRKRRLPYHRGFSPGAVAGVVGGLVVGGIALHRYGLKQG